MVSANTITAGDSLQAAVDAAAADLVAQRERLQQLQDDRNAVTAELAALDAESGEDLLDDPSIGDHVIEATAKGRVRLELLAKAVTAQQARVTAAQSAYLDAEADAIEPEVDAARSRLKAHLTKVAKLITELEDLEGEYVPRTELIESWRRGGVETTGVRWREPRSNDLRASVSKAATRVKVLRAMAAGEDPDDIVRPILNRGPLQMGGQGPAAADFYPPCVWRPGALVSAPVLVNRYAAAKRWVDELEQLADQLPDELRQLRQSLPSTPHTVGPDPTAEARIIRIEERLGRLPDEIEQARRDLATASDAVA